MDKIIGKGKISANSVIVYNNWLRRKKYVLSFNDSDAFPFGRFLIMHLNGEIIHKFYLGNQGQVHLALQQLANIENQKALGSGWLNKPSYNNFNKQFKIQSAGRIWTIQHIIIMRDSRPEPHIVKYAVTQLQKNGIDDIMSYALLYEDNEGYIHKCSLEDYLRSASSYGYQTFEELPNPSYDYNFDKEPTKEISQAEYNF